MVTASIIDIIRRRLGERVDRYRVPPPAFEAMQGEFLAYDAEAGTLTARSPILDHYLNPYGGMQGGMVAAAIDNAFGPLSNLVAPPNVTRRLEIKYSRPVTPDLGYVLVKARFLEQDGRWLHFKADVRDEGGTLLARARATHWIVDED